MAKIDAKVSPEAMQTILLDEIAGRLGDIHELLVRQAPKGNLYSMPVSVTAFGTKIVLLYSATVYNDGPADLYLLRDVNREIDVSDVPLKITESITIDLRTRTNREIWLKTKLGAASARVFALE